MTLQFAAAPDSVAATADNGRVAVVVPADGTAYRVAAPTRDGSTDVGIPTDPSATRTITASTRDGSVTILPAAAEPSSVRRVRAFVRAPPAQTLGCPERRCAASQRSGRAAPAVGGRDGDADRAVDRRVLDVVQRLLGLAALGDDPADARPPRTRRRRPS